VLETVHDVFGGYLVCGGSSFHPHARPGAETFVARALSLRKHRWAETGDPFPRMRGRFRRGVYEGMGQKRSIGVAGPLRISSRHVQQPEVAPQVQKEQRALMADFALYIELI